MESEEKDTKQNSEENKIEKESESESDSGGKLELAPLSRGAFMQTCFYGFAGAWGLMTLYPVCRYLTPAEKMKRRWLRVSPYVRLTNCLLVQERISNSVTNQLW